ncbi:MAG: sigma 54-interacting transcriptional regulator, partial [candidate division WOR-3 bacterium]
KDLIISVSSLFDDEFSIDWIEELTRIKASLILLTLEEGTQNGLFLRKRPGVYYFRDEKKKAEFAGKMDQHDKNRFHRQIAEILKRELPESPSKVLRVAEHLFNTSPLDIDACQCVLSAGEIYANSLVSHKAISYFEKVLKELSGTDGEGDLIFVRAAINFSSVFAARHDVRVSLSFLMKARERAKRLNNPAWRLIVEMHIAKYERLLGNFNNALARFKRALHKAKTVDNNELREESVRFQIYFLFWQGRFKQVIEVYEKSIPNVEKYPVGQFPIIASIIVGHSYGMVGNIVQAMGMLDAIHEYCLKKGDYYLSAHASSAMGMIMLSINKTEEAVKYFKLALKESRKGQNLWARTVVTVMLSYVFYFSGEKTRSLVLLRRFSKHMDRMRFNLLLYPYLIDLQLACEKGELTPLPGFSLKKQIDELLGVKNVYLKGIALRYLALLRKLHGEDTKKIPFILHRSSKLLERSGSKIELLKTKIELARYYLGKGKEKQAKKSLSSLSDPSFFGNIDLIPDDLRTLVQDRDFKNLMMEELMNITAQITKHDDASKLFQNLIASINRLIGAERGALFVLEESSRPFKFAIRASKNFPLEDMASPEFEFAERVLRETIESEQGKIFQIDNDNRYRSIVCFPVIFQGKRLGALYHENRLFPNAFKNSDVELLSYFSSLVGIYLDRERIAAQLFERDRQPHFKNEFTKSAENLSECEGFIAISPVMKKIMKQIEEVAKTDVPVLLLGETGVGKSLIASVIHRRSPRKDGPFVTVQCTALTESLITSELFGHEKGSFTGAVTRHIGKIERAHGGSLFLDEIGDLPTDVQARLLRVLETREFERVGGKETLTSNFRLIMATNKNLGEEVKAKRFREDLFYRINVFPIFIPPLRERKEEIPSLFEYFLAKYSLRYGKNFQRIPESVLETLLRYDWPGNIRELENVIQRSIILSPEFCFQLVPLEKCGSYSSEFRTFPTLKENERLHIIEALRRSNWKIYGRGGAAEILDVKPSTLISKMKKLGIKKPSSYLLS